MIAAAEQRRYLRTGCSLLVCRSILAWKPTLVIEGPGTETREPVGIEIERPGQVYTSHGERSHLTMRMQLRRLTRLTNRHSKKWENHEAMLTVYFAWYNFVRIHQTLRKTPAMAADLATEVWNIERLLTEAVAV